MTTKGRVLTSTSWSRRRFFLCLGPSDIVDGFVVLVSKALHQEDRLSSVPASSEDICGGLALATSGLAFDSTA